MAQSAGSIVVYAGAAQISPHVESGDLTAPSLAGTKIDVKKATSFVGGITYYWTDNISIDLPISAPFKHDIVGAGAIDARRAHVGGVQRRGVRRIDRAFENLRVVGVDDHARDR